LAGQEQKIKLKNQYAWFVKYRAKELK
jgi:hypothetical protein